MRPGKIAVLAFVAALTCAGSAMAQQSKTKSKSAAQLTKDYVNYSKKKANGQEVRAERASDPATVTREVQDTVDAGGQLRNAFRDRFNQFRQKATEQYENFRDEANKQYADFVRKAWDRFTNEPPVIKPQEKDVPPVVIADEDLLKPVEPNPIKIKDKVIDIPKIDPQPVPFEPIPYVPVIEEPEPEPNPVVKNEPVKTEPVKKDPVKTEPVKKDPVKTEPVKKDPVPTVPAKPDTRVAFTFYGTTMKVHFENNLKFTLKNCSSNAVADAWQTLSKKNYNNLIRDCLELRLTHQLSDWAYLQMLEKMSQACMGKTNEAVLLMSYVYCQSGYKMRMGTANNKLYVLYSSKNVIYGKAFFRVGGDCFYVYGGDGTSRLDICQASFPKEQDLSLWIPQTMVLTENLSEVRALKSRRYPDVNVSVQTNKNLLDFMDTYPSSMEGDDFMTRWAMYANTPLDARQQRELLPKLREKLKGQSQKEAVERLLNWVQTAFVYEYDEKVWGEDRAFFADETLYYPYCDCEDRSILFTRLVRDLLGLKCVLVYYPGHLASAVCFTENVSGDYFSLDGSKYVVCDPTFINAPVGRTMTGMNNAEATVIRLK